ncbi:hypothetical protein ACX80W_14695 [Arthrobacter sp. TMN-37]
MKAYAGALLCGAMLILTGCGPASTDGGSPPTGEVKADGVENHDDGRARADCVSVASLIGAEVPTEGQGLADAEARLQSLADNAVPPVAQFAQFLIDPGEQSDVERKEGLEAAALEMTQFCEPYFEE